MSDWTSPCGSVRVLCGDAMQRLRELPDGCIHTAVTSPPYFGLRDYGIPATVWGGDRNCDHEWGGEITQHKGGPPGITPTVEGRATNDARVRDYSSGAFCMKCSAWLGVFGLEPTPELYVEHGVLFFREVRRVLRDDATLWLNIGDSYNGSGGIGGEGKQHTNRGSVSRPDARAGYGGALKPKDLIGVPWMLAFALRADGWYLRAENIWFKKSPMPESVEDRTTRAHEQVFLFSKNASYFYDHVAIAEPTTGGAHARGHGKNPKSAAIDGNHRPKQNDSFSTAVTESVQLRNKRSVWTLGSEPFPGAHYATFPTKLVEPCILAGTSEYGCCAGCGSPYRRITTKTKLKRERPRDKVKRTGEDGTGNSIGNTVAGIAIETLGWEATCKCEAAVVPCVALDPFGGSGTTAQVAVQHKRHAVICELNPEYIPHIRDRLARPLSLEVSKNGVTQRNLFDA